MQGLYCVADTLSATYLQQYLQRSNYLSTSALHAFRCRWQMFLCFSTLQQEKLSFISASFHSFLDCSEFILCCRYFICNLSAKVSATLQLSINQCITRVWLQVADVFMFFNFIVGKTFIHFCTVSFIFILKRIKIVKKRTTFNVSSMQYQYLSV